MKHPDVVVAPAAHRHEARPDPARPVDHAAHQETVEVAVAHLVPVEGEVAQRVEDRCALVDFDGLDLVRMRAVDDAGAGVDRGPGDLLLLVDERLLRGDAPVAGDDHEVGPDVRDLHGADCSDAACVRSWSEEALIGAATGGSGTGRPGRSRGSAPAEASSGTFRSPSSSASGTCSPRAE